MMNPRMRIDLHRAATLRSKLYWHEFPILSHPGSVSRTS